MAKQSKFALGCCRTDIRPAGQTLSESIGIWLNSFYRDKPVYTGQQLQTMRRLELVYEACRNG